MTEQATAPPCLQTKRYAWWLPNHDPVKRRTTIGKPYFAARPRYRTNSSFNHTALAIAFPPPHFT